VLVPGPGRGPEPGPGPAPPAEQLLHARPPETSCGVRVVTLNVGPPEQDARDVGGVSRGLLEVFTPSTPHPPHGPLLSLPPSSGHDRSSALP